MSLPTVPPGTNPFTVYKAALDATVYPTPPDGFKVRLGVLFGLSGLYVYLARWPSASADHPCPIQADCPLSRTLARHVPRMAHQPAWKSAVALPFGRQGERALHRDQVRSLTFLTSAPRTC